MPITIEPPSVAHRRPASSTVALRLARSSARIVDPVGGRRP